MPKDENTVEETAEETAEETIEETIEETAEETAEETVDAVTIGDIMDAVRALDARISDIAAEIADLKSLRIESGVEYTDEGGIGDADEDPEPRSIDELDLTI